LIKHLGEFLPQEVGERSVLSDSTCIQPSVSDEAFYSVMEDLCTMKTIVEEEVEDMESVEVGSE